MSDFPAVMNHGSIEEVFPDVFFVTGTMRNEFFGSMWQFGRNMVVVREQGKLSLIGAVRLDDAGLEALDALGKVTNVVRIGSMHGHDDAFYVDRYSATYWAMPGMPGDGGPKVDKELSVGGELPFGDASLFEFKCIKIPECIIRLDREGGILISCDALQNWEAPDPFTDDETIATMTKMGFYTRGGVGPAWAHVNEPKPDDFVRLKEVSYKHALCGHGSPLLHTAREDFHATFARMFDL